MGFYGLSQEAEEVLSQGELYSNRIEKRLESFVKACEKMSNYGWFFKLQHVVSEAKKCEEFKGMEPSLVALWVFKKFRSSRVKAHRTRMSMVEKKLEKADGIGIRRQQQIRVEHMELVDEHSRLVALERQKQELERILNALGIDLDKELTAEDKKRVMEFKNREIASRPNPLDEILNEGRSRPADIDFLPEVKEGEESMVDPSEW